MMLSERVLSLLVITKWTKYMLGVLIVLMYLQRERENSNYAYMKNVR